MFYISECCRICLQYDKNLVDIANVDKNSTETLITKLKVCVSEVEWNSSNLLLCQSCIAKLNSAYQFKKQCLFSAETWKNYVELLNDSQSKAQSQVSVSLAKDDVSQDLNDDNVSKSQIQEADKNNSFIRVVPNQKLVKLYVGSQPNLNTFQNVFLNLIPADSLSKQNSINHLVVPNPNLKETNRNVFLNIDNTLQNFITIPQNKEIIKTPTVSKKVQGDLNVSKILTETKTEELSVEIDPMDFDCFSEESPPAKDWEEAISRSQVRTIVPKLDLNKKEQEIDNKNFYSNFVPILPKPQLNHEITNEEKYDFFNGGHFLTPKDTKATFHETSYPCELCNKTFDTLKTLRFHLKQTHLGRFPFKCEQCFAEFAVRNVYAKHLEMHINEDIVEKDSLTLQDFPKDEDETKTSIDTQLEDTKKLENGEATIHICDVCSCSFSSANGLLRHKSRKHKQKNKKKYFIKGMKNARCDICNRDFSTQSYLQLHLKLHERNGPGYRGKIFKNKNIKEVKEEIAETVTEERSETPKGEGSSENVEDQIPSIKIKINLKNLKALSESGDDNISNQSIDEMEIDTSYKTSDEECSEEISNINLVSSWDVNKEYESLVTKELFSAERKDEATFQNKKTFDLPCIYCKEIFDTKFDLKAHLTATHLKTVQYKCNLCNNSFDDTRSLMDHLNIHMTSASCTICQKMVSTELEMKKHNMWLHSDKAFWQCGICSIIFTIRELKSHMVQHDSTLAYVCHFCEETFSDKEKYGNHIKEHRGLYHCKICKSKFGYEFEKNSHDIFKHSKNTFDCMLCGKKYNKMHELTRHRNLHQWHPKLLDKQKDELLRVEIVRMLKT